VSAPIGCVSFAISVESGAWRYLS